LTALAFLFYCDSDLGMGSWCPDAVIGAATTALAVQVLRLIPVTLA